MDTLVTRILSFKRPDESTMAFCQRAGLFSAQLYYWKRHNGGDPRIGTVERIARRLNCSPSWLAFGEGDKTHGSDSNQH